MANEKNQLALAGNNVPDYIKPGNRGNENVATALAIPRIKQLQKMSDEVDKHHPKYVEGADPGMFINSISNELLGDVLYVVSVNFKTEYVVWRTRA